MRTILIDEVEASLGQTTQIFDTPNRTIIGMVGDYGLGFEIQDLINGFLNLENRYQAAINRLNIVEEKINSFDGDKALVKVGQLVEIDASVSDMTAFMGYGSWELFGRGRMTICSGTIKENDTNFSFQVGQTGGEVKHFLVVDELPEHDHDMNESSHHDWIGNRNGVSRGDIPNTTQTGRRTGKTGGNQGHNNLSPYIVVQRWKRIG